MPAGLLREAPSHVIDRVVRTGDGSAFVTQFSLVRQQLLFLCVANPNPTSAVVAWSLFDGTGHTTTMAGDSDTPPYDSVLAAMKDGWRVIQAPQPIAPPADQEHQTAFLRFEYLLEKLIETGETHV